MPCVDLSWGTHCRIRQMAAEDFDDERIPVLYVGLSVPVVRVTVGPRGDDGAEREPLMADWNVMDVPEPLASESARPRTPPRDPVQLVGREQVQAARAAVSDDEQSSHHQDSWYWSDSDMSVQAVSPRGRRSSVSACRRAQPRTENVPMFCGLASVEGRRPL